MKFYIGSGMKNCKLVNYYAKRLKEKGWEQTYNWVTAISEERTKRDLIKYANLEVQAIEDADMVIIILPGGRGTHVELGMSLALNKKIVLCANTKEEFTIENTVNFYELPQITQLVGEPDDNLDKIVDL